MLLNYDMTDSQGNVPKTPANLFLCKIVANGTIEKFESTGFLPLQLDDVGGAYIRVYPVQNAPYYKNEHFPGITCQVYWVDATVAANNEFLVIEDELCWYLIPPEKNSKLLLSTKCVPKKMTEKLW